MLNLGSFILTVFISIVIFVSVDRYALSDVSAQGIDNINMNISSRSSTSILNPTDVNPSSSFPEVDRFDQDSIYNYSNTNFHKGLITSHLYPNTTIENVKILPHRHDGYGYTGILTFTSSKPVEVVLAHSIPMNGSEIAGVEDKFGKIYKFFEKVDYLPNVLSIPTVLEPNYGTHSPYFSATIPFSADSVILRNIDGEPFVAIYEVSFQVVKPHVIVDEESME